MSDNKEIYHRYENHHGYGGASPFDTNNNPLLYPQSFSDYLHGSMDYSLLTKAFDLSCSSPSEVKPMAQNQMLHVDPSLACSSSGGAGGESGATLTPNSSISSSSTEAGACEENSGGSRKEQRQQPKGFADGTDKSKKVSKPRKKGEKRQREQRFAFVTKSEVDHLEDGYRWRKYGQKAVKNSPFPRSYYRCTTPKCTVKKRVERSYQDPSVVVTTYEGQHTHQSPTTLRGNSYMLAATPPLISGYGQESPMHQHQHQHQHQMLHPGLDGLDVTNHLAFLQNMSSASPQQFPAHGEEYGLLQDIVPPFIPKKQQ